MPADKHPLYVIGSGGGDLVDGSGGDFGGGSLGKGEAIGEVMKRNGGLVEAMGGCRPPTPTPAGWVRPGSFPLQS